MTGFTYGTSSGATYGGDTGGSWSPTITATGQPRGPTGGTYGSDTGFAYGTDAGGLWSPGSRLWTIGQTPIPNEAINEVRNWESLELVWRVDADTLERDLRPLRETAEKVETVTDADGGFRALDRALTDGVYRLKPPVDRDPPRHEQDVLIGGYSDRSLDQPLDRYEVSVDFRPQENREPDGASTDERRSTDEWAFEFRSAKITTHRVVYDPEESTETGANSISLTLILDAEQTKALEESASRLAAANVQEVPDGENVATDDSSTNANTVTVTTPDGTDDVEEGEWVVLDWETEWLSARGYQIELTLAT